MVPGFQFFRLSKDEGNLQFKCRNVFRLFRLFRNLALSSIVLILLFGQGFVVEQKAQSDSSPVKIVDGYPQLRLYGRPFFAHSAAFFYNRIPRDEWADSLVKLKSMGINTIDLYIAWNWHEPEEGKIDFDGRSNPRRDVKGLLEMLDQMGFAVIARPGPVILNEWRNGGYPDWLLERPEFQMHPAARLDGHYPPLSSVSASNSEEASRIWLSNETHLKYTRHWFGDCMRELLKDRQATAGGNVIAIQLDDDQAINRANYNGPVFWKYMSTLADYLREAGATVPVYINPTDMRVSAAGAQHNIGAMGQWYFNFAGDPSLRWEDTATLQFYTETLRTQPHFPPMIIEYQAGWYGTGDDAYAKAADKSNTLLSSRVMIGHGLRGLNYFPVQDTLYPAGYEVPWANHYYIWESALNLARDERPRASAVHRNGRLLAGLGAELASTHKAADLGLVYPISSFDQPSLTRDEILKISRAQMQIQQFCQLNQLAVEYLDLEFQPLEHLKRHKAILLPVFDEATLRKVEAGGREEITAANDPTQNRNNRTSTSTQPGRLRLSELAQLKLVDYVRSGGRLIFTPAAPQGEAIKSILNNPDVSIVPDFWRNVPIEPGKTNREELIASVQASSVEFVSRLARMGINRRVKARISYESASGSGGESVGATIEPNFITTMLVPDSPGSKFAFVGVTSFDSNKALKINLNISDPASESGASRIVVPEFRLSARESMMLPVRLPLTEVRGEIVYATAELIATEIANGRIRMRLYSQASAEVALILPHAPQGAITIDGVAAISSYNPANKLLRITIPDRIKITGKPDQAGDRREHEHDIEIVYEKGLPELSIKNSRLIIAEDNQVQVEVANRTSSTLKGILSLQIEQGLKHANSNRDVELKPEEVRRLTFSLPISEKAVSGDSVNLKAVLSTDNNQTTYRSPKVSLEILPRFDWELYPVSSWPLRPDTKQKINPPLIYPKDDQAKEAEVNLKLVNNSEETITLSRSSMLVSSLPVKLGKDEQYMNTFIYGFPAGTRSALHPFSISVSDGRRTETANVNFVALRKGEAIAFSCDIDRDGFDDYVLENEHLRLIISPRAGARSFALINKRTGANLFTSAGGLRDKFVELDPADPTRNARRKRGMYGTFNRPYAAEILDGMGKQAVIKLSYQAPDAYPAGVNIERTVTLKAGEEFFTMDYRIKIPSPEAADGIQALWSSNSIVAGDPAFSPAEFITAAGHFDFKTATSRSVDAASGLIVSRLDNQNSFAIIWRSEQMNTAEIEMKEFSSFVNLKFKPFIDGLNSYRLVYYCGNRTFDEIRAQSSKIIGR